MSILKLVVAAVCCTIGFSALAQTKQVPNKKAVSTKQATKASKPKEVKEENYNDAPPPPVERLLPTINFDTTAAPADVFTKDIVELLTLTGALENDVKAADLALRQNLGEQMDAKTTTFYQRFMSEMREGNTRRWLTNLYIRTYRQSFTPSEVKEIIQFYQTPIGKKVIEKTPLLMQAVSVEAQKIGAYIGQTIMADIMKTENNQ